MNTRVQVACAWAGFVGIALILVALIVGGYLPPPAANDTAEELAAFYREDTDRIRVGVFIGLLATAGWGALVAVTAVQLRRAEGDRPVMAWLQAVSGAVTYVALLMCFTLLALASFRPEREPESTQLLHDLGWFCLVFTVVAPATQAISTGVGILADTRTDPVFPRWLGYLGFWAGVLFVPGVALVFFKTGPFAYHGIVSWWIPLFAFGGWVAALAWGCRRAALRDAEPVTQE